MATFKKVVTESADDTIAQSTTGSAATLTTARAIAVSGDITGSANFNGSAGISISSTLGADVVDGTNIADDSIDSEHYVDGSIDAAHIASNAITQVKIADDAVGAAELATGNAVSSSTDGYILSWNDTAGDMRWVEAGDITSVVAGNGLSGGATSGAATLTVGAGSLIDVGSTSVSVDLTELANMTAGFDDSADYIVVLDGGSAQAKKLASGVTVGSANTLATARTIAGVSFDGSANISLNNNAITNGAGYTTNTGTVTSVATGTGIAGGTITGSGTISLALSELTVGSTFTAGADAIPFHDDGAGADKLAESGTIPVSFFNNDANYVQNTRTLTAGNGLTGGGSLSANRTFAVGAGTGVTVASNSVSIGQDVATNADVDFATVTTTGNVTVGGDLTVSGQTITTATETLEIADNTLILNSDLGSNAGVDAGFVVERGTSGDNAALFYDNSDASWKVGTSSTQALPSDGARIALQSVKNTLDTTDTSVPVGGFQVAGGVAYVRTA